MILKLFYIVIYKIMISTLVNNLHNNSRSIISTTTRLKETFNYHKKNLNVFKNLNEGEKLGKQINNNGDSEYYKVSHYTGIQISRWWYCEGRIKTVEYLDNDFTEFMKFLDELITNLEVDPFCKYAKMAKDVRVFIDSILTGLYSLKKTYPNTEKMKAKVDSIILTLLDFKEKTDDYINQKHKGIKLLIGTNV